MNQTPRRGEVAPPGAQRAALSPRAEGEPPSVSLAEAVIRSSVDGILAFDRAGCYTLWNPAMERISGVPAAQTLGRCAFDVFPFLKETGEDRCFAAALAGRTVVSRDRPYRIPETGRHG